VVHRRGATRACPPGHPELAETYRSVGQPVLIPGDMGRYSYVLVGAPGAMRETFGSTCHGAGRVLSRTAAVKAARGRSIADELRARGIVARAGGRESLAEEMSEAYKDVRNLVDVVHRPRLPPPVRRLRPLGVVKGWREGPMKVKGILVEGRDGQESLLGFRHEPNGRLAGPPTLSRRRSDGTLWPFEDLQEASKVSMAQLVPREAHVIGPGWGKELFLWRAFADALKSMPALPTWPTWRPPE